MPKNIELTIEIAVQRVSCPGVWLCQDGRVSLRVFALGTRYHTCALPPVFPLLFKDVFYFRKEFVDVCALNNINCLLKDETIYCELMQYTDECEAECGTLLAQYLGSLPEVLFPPNTCSKDGVDLLMRRSKDFPGILSPKIEIATKVRIDEVWDQCYQGSYCKPGNRSVQKKDENNRQKPVCHTPQYHRRKCAAWYTEPSRSSCCVTPVEPIQRPRCGSLSRSRCGSPRRVGPSRYNVFNVEMPDPWISSPRNDEQSLGHDKSSFSCEQIKKTILESRHINEKLSDTDEFVRYQRMPARSNYRPCVCEICKKYHELFHNDDKNDCIL